MTMDSFFPSPILRGRSHRSASTSKAPEEDSWKAYYNRHSHSHTRRTDKEKGKERERERQREREREKERERERDRQKHRERGREREDKEKDKVKPKMKEERTTKERGLPSVENEKDVGSLSRVLKWDKAKHKIETTKALEKYEQDKLEKIRKKVRSAEEEVERPRSAPLTSIERNFTKYLEVDKQKKRSSKPKELFLSPRKKSASSTSTEESAPRRSKSIKQKSPNPEKADFPQDLGTGYSKDNISAAAYHHREQRPSDQVLAAKKDAVQEDVRIRKTFPENSKGKERVALGFDLHKKDNLIKCVSCLSDDISQHDAALLTCGHYFCHDCLKELFKLSLRDPAHMPPKCCANEHIPLKHVENLLSYREKKEWNSKYQEFTTANRIYCPTADCGVWIREKDIRNKIGTCPKCNTQVCTLCRSKAHGRDECPNDEELKAFVATAKAHGYQRCFSCRAVIELEKGCNHITCRCTAEFCYLCGEKWKICDCPWFNYEPDDDDDDCAEDYPLRILGERYERNLTQRLRGRQRQIVEDEALAMRLADEEFRESRSARETRNRPLTSLGTVSHGLRDGVKRSTVEPANEPRKPQENDRQAEIRNRAQRLRRGNSVTRHEYTSDERKMHKTSDQERTNHRDGVREGGRHFKSSQEPAPTPIMTEPTPRRLSANEQRAAFIRRYILGEDFKPEAQSTPASRRPHTSYSSQNPGIIAGSSNSRRPSHGHSRRISDSCGTAPGLTQSTRVTVPGGLLHPQARLDPYPSATSPTKFENAYPSASTAPYNCTNISDTNGSDTNTISRNSAATPAALNTSVSAGKSANTHNKTNPNTNTLKTFPAASASNGNNSHKTDVEHGVSQHPQEKVKQQQQKQPPQQDRHLPVPGAPSPTCSTTYPLPVQTTYSYRINSLKPLATEQYTRPHTSHGWEANSFQARRPSWSPLPESFASRIQVTAGGTVILPRKY